MTDNMEKAVQRIATKKNGSEKTVNDVFEVVIALAEDSDANHEENSKALATTNKLLEEHCSEALVRDLEIGELQEWRRRSSSECIDKITSIVQKEHDRRHGDHMKDEHPPIEMRRMSDPSDSEFTEKRESAFPEDEEMGDLRRFWRVGKWVLAAILIFWIDTLSRYVSHIILGYPN